MKNKKKILLLIIIAILIIFGTQFTYALLTSDTTATVNEKIAKFIFNTNKTNNISLSLDDLKPSDERVYPFEVTNNYDNIASDVTIDYQINIKTMHLIPLTIDLYKVVDDNEELVLSCNETNKRNSKNELECITEVQELEYKNKKNDNYKLKINFPIQYNTTEYTDLVDYIDLEISSWQKIEG